MEKSPQTKFWIENILKKRPTWEGEIDDSFSIETSSISMSFSKFRSSGIPPWQIGDSILGRFKVLEIRGGPGRSGMGVVFVVMDKETGNIYAAKTLQDWCAHNTRSRKRFEREARMWIELENHPNIVKAHFIEHVIDRPYLFLEFVPGSDVSSRVRVGSINTRLAVKFGIQICRAMSHAARRFPGFVHRDIKPSNCLTWQENLKLTDFGLAKAMDKTDITQMPDENQEHPSGISKEGKRLGTIPYMAPELFMHGSKQDSRSDIYSFGMTLYKMITGKFPYKATSPEEWMDSHINKQPVSPIEYSPNIPVVLNELILKCLSKDPAKRFNDFTQIGELLSAVLLKNFGERLPRDTPQRLESRDIINKAISYSRLGLHKEALDYFDRALTQDPSNPDALTGKAITLSKIGLGEEALENCDKALLIDQYFADAWIIKGRIYSNNKMYDRAVACFDVALSLRPEATDVMFEKGENLLNMGKLNEALSCYEKIIEIQPSSVSGWLMKGFIQLELGNYEDSINSSNQVLKLQSGQFAEAWACKGDAYFRMGRLSKAEKCFTKALTIEPNHPFYMALLACTYVRMGQKASAKKIFDNAMNIDHSIKSFIESLDEYRALSEKTDL